MIKRYFFGLVGSKNLDDPLGLAFGSPVAAFRWATQLAEYLAEVQPELRGCASVIVTQSGSPDTYYVGIESQPDPRTFDTALTPKQTGGCFT